VTAPAAPASIQPGDGPSATSPSPAVSIPDASPQPVLEESEPHWAGNGPAGEPLRLVFPTPAPAPVSAWRPPLYPVPWAVSEYDHFYFSRPIAADEVNWPVADYRYGGTFFEDAVHTGVDIPAPLDTPVLAAGPGKVVWAGYGVYSGGENPDDPYGLAVVIRHDFGYEGEPLYTVYGHMSQIDVAVGQHVENGEPLGLIGVTGFTTGPHLHFEVRLGVNRFLTTRNPELWVAPPQGWGVLSGRVLSSGNRFAPRQLVYVRNLETDQVWTVRTYSLEAVNSDPYYRENLVLGDLPAGSYLVSIPYGGFLYEQEITILPGVVNYFSFRGFKGFEMARPPTPEAEFTPGFP
jgi:murein DD-endopeptidase MepM/ murein hydrolase activator NlpD